MKNLIILTVAFCLSLTSYAQSAQTEQNYPISKDIKKSFKQNKFGISFQTKKWSNTEKVNGKEFVKFSGTLNGIKLDYRYDFKSNPFFFETALGYVTSENTNYDGGSQDGKSFSYKDTNSIADFDLQLGRFFTLNDFISAKLSAGFYFRSLSNPRVNYKKNDYGRRIHYQTFALKAGTIFSLTQRFFIHPQVRYDHLLAGRVLVKFSDLDPRSSDLLLKQRKGRGYRLDLTFGYTFNNFTLAMTPYYRSWDLEDSDMAVGFLEPKNKTESIGLDIGVKLF